MFGLALSHRLIQGPAVRGWNSITHFANLLWCKFNHPRNTIMPRSRRRYQSRSRSRSRSHSYDRDRELKRRRIDGAENSPYHRSDSPEDEMESVANEDSCVETSTTDLIVDTSDANLTTKSVADSNSEKSGTNLAVESASTGFIEEPLSTSVTGAPLHNSSIEDPPINNFIEEPSSVNLLIKQECKVLLVDCGDLAEKYKMDQENSFNEQSDMPNCSYDLQSSIDENTDVESTNPKTHLTPGQKRKQLERQKLREAKQAEFTLKKQLLLEEKLKIKEEKTKEREEKRKIKQEQEDQKLKEKQEKKELKQKEIDEKNREKEEKKKKELEEREQRRKEKEEKEEMKRKEKEEKEEQKRKELEEKQREKQKQDEKKQKLVTMFASFFTKKTDPVNEEKRVEESPDTSFMPFKIKADMRVAPLCRRFLTEEEKSALISSMEGNTQTLYIQELNAGKLIGHSEKTWCFDDDDVILVENIGQSIYEVPKVQKPRFKLLKFHENRRPPFFGTWRQKSNIIKARSPLQLDKNHFNYEIDSDDEWEEEDPCGESLCGSDDEEKENEADNDYELDDDVFVPHGYLSGDEVNDEEDVVESPEAHKLKLKLLKNKFDEEMKDQTQKIKPWVIGCIWEKKCGNTIDDAIYEFLKPFSMLYNVPVVINKRHYEVTSQTPIRKNRKPLDAELVPSLLKFVHGSTCKMKTLINEFLSDLSSKGIQTEVSKKNLKSEIKKFAEWTRNPEDGPMHNKFCWYVNKAVRKEQ